MTSISGKTTTDWKACFGVLVTRPKSPAAMARCLSLLARHRVPVTLRGGGTGNYGQSVPMEGGLIIDTTAMAEILEIGPDFVRVQAGRNILKLNEALKARCREMPVFPSTQDIATVGGVISGGSAGIVPEGRAMLVTLIPRPQLAEFGVLIAAHDGQIALTMDEAKLPQGFEFSCNHTTLQALKTDRKVTCLQILCPAPLNVASLADIHLRRGFLVEPFPGDRQWLGL